MRILITGSRNWTNQELLTNVLDHVIAQNLDNDDLTFLHGACPTGADALVDSLLTERGYAVERYSAEWDRHGKAAGPIRNQQMVDTKPDFVIGFVMPDSAGTLDCLRRAKKAGVPTLVVKES